MDFWKVLIDSVSKNRIVRFITSVRFVAVIISLVTFLSFIGMVIPQENIYSVSEMEKWSGDYPLMSRLSSVLGLTHIFYTWWFLLLLFLVFVSMFFCTLLRIKPRKKVFKKIYKKPPLLLNNQPLKGEIKKFLFQKLYFVRVKEEKKEVFIKAKRGSSRFFSIIFHLGMMILLLAVVADKTGGLNGEVLLTEGQTFTEAHFNYISVSEGMLFNEDHQFFNILLDKVEVHYEKDVMTEMKAHLQVFDNSLNKKYQVLVNYPLAYKGFSFLIERTGFSPLINIIDANGSLIFSSFVSLKEKKEERFEDYFDLGDYTIYLFFTPNTVSSQKVYLVDKPLLDIELKKDEKVIWESRLSFGQSVSSPIGVITFPDLRRWVYFNVTYNPSLNLIFFCLFLISLCLTARFLFIQRIMEFKIWPKEKKWAVNFDIKSKKSREDGERMLVEIEKFLTERYN